MKRYLTFVVVLLTVASIQAASQYKSKDEGRQQWAIADFPDPHLDNREEQMRCYRHSVSSVCNPNNIISETDADAIDYLINTVYRNTTCPCLKWSNEKHGYVIRVAVINGFEKTNRNAPITQQAMLREAKRFSYLLSLKWRMEGDCNETLLILYSKNDQLLFTLTRKTARDILKDSDVSRISMAVRTYFDNVATIGDGILEMIRQYKLIFDK